MKKETSPLPVWLRLTPKRKAKIKEQQDALRAEAMSRGRLSPEARRLSLGIAHETSARADVELLTSEGAEARTSEPLRLARGRLAEALAHQGRYVEAAAVTVDPAQQAHYHALWVAVWRDDKETCPCVPVIHEGLALTHDHVSEEVLSVQHNKMMPAIKCNACGFLNVRPLTHELLQLQRHRERSLALLHGRRPEDLLRKGNEFLASLHDNKVLKR